MRRFKILQTLFLLSASISSAGTLTENAEEESPAVTAAIDSSYSHVQTEVAPQGNKAFFLTHTGADQSDQTITLDNSFTRLRIRNYILKAVPTGQHQLRLPMQRSKNLVAPLGLSLDAVRY